MAHTTIPALERVANGNAAIAKIPPQIVATPAQAESLAGGLGGAIGCDFIAATNQLAFVEYNPGNVSILNLIQPLLGIVSQGTATIGGTETFNCETGASGAAAGAGDLWWEQIDGTHRRMVPQNGAAIVNLGHVDFAALTSASLQGLTYGATPLVGDNDAANVLTAGDVFAVRTGGGNLCKVQVLAYGYALQVQYATYRVGARYRILGSGYQQPEDIVVEPDALHAFVSERAGNVLRVDLSNASRSAAQVLVSGLTMPHQMQLSASRAELYVVEYAPGGRLLRIELANGATTTVAGGLDHPIGLVLDGDEQFAYVTEQATGGGRVRRVALANGAIGDVAGGLTAPFMADWADEAREVIVLCERDPANRLAFVDTASRAVTRPLVTLGFRPSCVAVMPFGRALVTCDTEIDACRLGVPIATGPLFKGIGNVPFDRVVNGLADTNNDPTYFYQVKNAPFGGVLPLRVNHLGAYADGARYYRVLLDGAPRTDAFTDYRWNTATARYEIAQIVPQNLSPALQNVYAIRDPATFMLWYQSDLGDRLDSTAVPDGMHTLEIQFLNAFGGLVTTSGALQVKLDNAACSASIAAPHIGGRYASANCGVLTYASGTEVVTLAFAASQPHDSATYTFTAERGVTPLTPPSQSGDVAGPLTLTATAASLLGGCAVAGFAEYLYVATKAINGETRQSQYDASASRAFVLAT